MNKTEMVTLLEGRLGSRSAAVAALDGVLTEIQNAVAAGERVTLTGFGTFERVQRPARTGRNPRTGAAIEIPAATAPRFHAGSVLRAAVAGPVAPDAARTGRTTSGTTAAATAAATSKPAKARKKPSVTPAAKAPAKASAPATAPPASKVKASKVKATKVTATKPAKADKSTKKSGPGKASKASGSKKKKK